MVRRNPLNRRWKAELKSDIGRYLMIFLLLVISVGVVSGFLVADGSMILAYDESFEKYNIEDGKFTSGHKLNRSQIKYIENGEVPVKVYENFYTEVMLDGGSKMRIFADRTEVDLVCLMSGRMPEGTGEIAVDRMYADNNSLSEGDVITAGDRSWKITGLVALSDYSCLFENNNDTMFDSVKFGVSVVTKEEFDSLPKDSLVYHYAWKYVSPPSDEKQEKELSEDLMAVMADETDLKDFVPGYLNQAVIFTGDDMGSDKAMMEIFLYIIIAILAFVFGLTASDTIAREATVIGTLRASGYTRNELIRHYMMLPLMVTTAGAVVGNILGYTYFKDFCADLYYGSYSLPTYHTIWSFEALLKTTLIPMAIMIVVTYIILARKLRLSPIRFMRNDLSEHRQKRAAFLPYSIPFMQRFRLRIILQNTANYLLLGVGILFANTLLMFGMGLPMVLDHFQQTIQENILAEHQYILALPVSSASGSHLNQMAEMVMFANGTQTDNPDAEKFMASSLYTPEGQETVSEGIMIYGCVPDSRYVHLNMTDEDVFVSALFADKYRLKEGDEITLHERFEGTEYTFTVTGISDYEGSLCMFMTQKHLNEVLDLDPDTFAGYFSNSEITDIDRKYIDSEINYDSLTKVSRQLDVSFGEMMYLLDFFSVIMFMILIYLLSKIIIEKNSQSISMAKILGYTNGEISGLYIHATTLVVLVLLGVSLPLVVTVLKNIYQTVMRQMLSGWLPFWLDSSLYLKMYALGAGTYLAVAALEYRKIVKVPMEEALKNAE